MRLETKATAVVTLTIRVQVATTWGADCSLTQIREQATEAALDQLRPRANQTGPLLPFPYELVGTPRVTAILVEVDR